MCWPAAAARLGRQGEVTPAHPRRSGFSRDPATAPGAFARPPGRTRSPHPEHVIASEAALRPTGQVAAGEKRPAHNGARPEEAAPWPSPHADRSRPDQARRGCADGAVPREQRFPLRNAEAALREAIRELLFANPDENKAQARIAIAKAAGILSEDVVLAEDMLQKHRATKARTAGKSGSSRKRKPAAATGAEAPPKPAAKQEPAAKSPAAAPAARKPCRAPWALGRGARAMSPGLLVFAVLVLAGSAAKRSTTGAGPGSHLPAGPRTLRRLRGAVWRDATALLLASSVPAPFRRTGAPLLWTGCGLMAAGSSCLRAGRCTRWRSSSRWTWRSGRAMRWCVAGRTGACGIRCTPARCLRSMSFALALGNVGACWWCSSR